MSAETRNEARTQIVQAANRWLINRYSRRMSRPNGGRVGAPLLAQRHLHRAVRICRHHGLVDDDVLAKAGFRPQPQRGPDHPLAREASA